MSSTDKTPAQDVSHIEGMSYLDSPLRKAMTTYVPLVVFLIVLLFPFYWMAVTAFKPDDELLSRTGNPFWVHRPTLAAAAAALPP